MAICGIVERGERRSLQADGRRSPGRRRCARELRGRPDRRDVRGGIPLRHGTTYGCAARLLDSAVEIRDQRDGNDDGENDGDVECGEERGPLLGRRSARSAGGIPTGFSTVRGHASRQFARLALAAAAYVEGARFFLSTLHTAGRTLARPSAAAGSRWIRHPPHYFEPLICELQRKWATQVKTHWARRIDQSGACPFSKLWSDVRQGLDGCRLPAWRGRHGGKLEGNWRGQPCAGIISHCHARRE
jgi:hypothetical protein